MIQRELDMKINNTFFWTDSTCVLSYLTNQDKRFQTFIANRVATIHGGSQLSQGKHVESDSNPANNASRGLSAKDF